MTWIYGTTINQNFPKACSSPSQSNISCVCVCVGGEGGGDFIETSVRDMNWKRKHMVWSVHILEWRTYWTWVKVTIWYSVQIMIGGNVWTKWAHAALFLSKSKDFHHIQNKGSLPTPHPLFLFFPFLFYFWWGGRQIPYLDSSCDEFFTNIPSSISRVSLPWPCRNFRSCYSQ